MDMHQRPTQDHSVDQSTGGHPQVFDADGYVVGAVHHDGMTQSDVIQHDSRLIRDGAATRTNEFGSLTRPVRGFDHGAQ